MNIFNKKINLLLIILLVILIFFILYKDYNTIETLPECSGNTKIKQSGSKKGVITAHNSIQKSTHNTKIVNNCLNLKPDSYIDTLNKLSK